MSGPVWMYRKGEARLFASPDEIPADEGWMDSPASVAEQPETEEQPKKRRKVEKVNDDDGA